MQQNHCFMSMINFNMGLEGHFIKLEVFSLKSNIEFRKEGNILRKIEII